MTVIERLDHLEPRAVKHLELAPVSDLEQFELVHVADACRGPGVDVSHCGLRVPVTDLEGRRADSVTHTHSHEQF